MSDEDDDDDKLTEKLEATLRPLRYKPVDPAERARRASKSLRATPSPHRRRNLIVGAFAAIALAAGVFAILRGPDTQQPLPPVASGPSSSSSATPFFAVARVAGQPKIAQRPMTGAADRLELNAWLETDDASRADITLGKVGTVHVEPKTRLRLINIAPTQHRLELQTGAIEAKVIAPPRLFIVDTPAARATDLGCAYRLSVTPDGGSFLHVTSGVVELDGHGRNAWVPAGAVCQTHPEKGPGAPYYDDALDAFKDALHRFENNEDEPGVIESLVSAARPHDTLTLWHLKARTNPRAQALLTTRIHELVPGAKDAGSVEDLVTHW